MTLSKIIVGTDFSEQAECALKQSMVLARHSGADLVLVHALSLPEPNYSTPYPIATPVAYAEQIEEITIEARKKLEGLRESYLGQGVEISHVFIRDMPGRGIVEYASEVKADLIVMGSHGRTGLSRFLIGSVAEKVATTATCDVMIARGEVPSGGYKKILVPVDYSNSGDLAIARATELVEVDGSIELFHCWQLPGGAGIYWGVISPALRDSLREGGQAYGEQRMERFASERSHFNLVLKEGDARHSIRKRVESGDYDLVVMGTHGRKGLNRLLLGSVSQNVLRHSTKPVYLVRAAEDSGT